MVIIRIIGGLGNQMFQYIVGKIVSQIFNVPLKMDLRDLYSAKDVHNKFALSIFGIQPIQASRSEYFKFFRQSLFHSKTLWSFVKKLFRITYYVEPDFKYDPNFYEKITPNIYLNGLFQSEKYFADYKDLVYSTYQFPDFDDEQNRLLAQKIISTNSVAVHFRRGDYVTNPTYKKILGPLPNQYYYKALEEIQRRVNEPFFYFFSDEPQWIRKNFDLPKNSVVVDYNADENDYWKDMKLMSMCKHNIIANSTFSWWAAWLNKNPNKIVIAPKHWFADDSIKNKHLLPQNWLKI